MKSDRLRNKEVDVSCSEDKESEAEMWLLINTVKAVKKLRWKGFWLLLRSEVMNVTAVVFKVSNPVCFSAWVCKEKCSVFCLSRTVFTPSAQQFMNPHFAPDFPF